MGYGKHVVWIWKWMMCATSREHWQDATIQKQLDLNRHGIRIVQELHNLAGVPEDKLPKKWNCSRKFEGSTIDSTAAVFSDRKSSCKVMSAAKLLEQICSGHLASVSTATRPHGTGRRPTIIVISIGPSVSGAV